MFKNSVNRDSVYDGLFQLRWLISWPETYMTAGERYHRNDKNNEYLDEESKETNPHRSYQKAYKNWLSSHDNDYDKIWGDVNSLVQEQFKKDGNKTVLAGKIFDEEDDDHLDIEWGVLLAAALVGVPASPWKYASVVGKYVDLSKRQAQPNWKFEDDEVLLFLLKNRTDGDFKEWCAEFRKTSYPSFAIDHMKQLEKFELSISALSKQKSTKAAKVKAL